MLSGLERNSTGKKTEDQEGTLDQKWISGKVMKIQMPKKSCLYICSGEQQQ